MATIRAPFSAPPNVLGIGRHRLEFDDGGECPDPGLNAGERAYLRGKGYTFTDTAPAPKRAPAKPKSKPAPVDETPTAD